MTEFWARKCWICQSEPPPCCLVFKGQQPCWDMWGTWHGCGQPGECHQTLHFCAQHHLLLGSECSQHNLEQPLCCSMLQRSQGFKPQGQGEMAQSNLSLLPCLMLPAVNYYLQAKTCFQNICGRECLLDKSDLDGTGWVNEGIMKIFHYFTLWSLISIKWVEYLLIHSSTE